jgi:HD-GYP domain-containing protein (c-di-GMP phosphodiesterase class II)
VSYGAPVDSRDTGRGDIPVAMLAALVSVASIAHVVVHGFGDGLPKDLTILHSITPALKGADSHTMMTVGLAMIFTALIAIGEMLRIRLPNERVAAPVASAFAVAYALIVQFGDYQQLYGIAQVVVVTTAGAILGSVISSLVSQIRRLDGATLPVEEIARRILATAAVRLIAIPLISNPPVINGSADISYLQLDQLLLKNNAFLLATLMLIAAVAGTAVDSILVALSRAFRQSAPLDRALKDEFRESLPIGVPITSSAVLMALAAPWMGWWALVVFAMPVLLSQFAFGRYARVVSTNESTIRALARVTELGGYTEIQHADRVADVCRQIGLQMGLSSKQQLALERGALMHDIGQLSLAEAIPGGRVSPGTPFIPGGATILLPLDQQVDLASKGAAVVRDTKFLDDVADIVEHQVDPYRARGGTVNESVPVASRIIKVANAYDDLVGGSMEADRRLQAVARLREGSGYEYDPIVVDVLSRIVSPRLS